MLTVASLSGVAAAPRPSFPDAPDLWTALDDATKVAERNLGDKFKAEPQQWWRQMGHTAQVPKQVASLRAQLSKVPALKSGTICEIGFNAGHSAIAWLEATKSRVVEFDLLALPYSRASRSFVETRYPERTAFHEGDSKDTVEKYARRVSAGSATPCDLWLVDGDHGVGAKLDLFNAIAASHDRTIVIADDAGLLFPYVRKYWRVHVGIGSIFEHGCASTRVPGGGVEKTWCIGHVASWTLGESGGATLRERFEKAMSLSREARNAAYFGRRRMARSLARNGTLVEIP